MGVLWNDGLLAQQRQAAGAEPGHYLLLAGPGTGKTYVLVRRIQYLVEERGVPPAEISALTFTRAAAAEMKERLETRIQAFRVRVSTLHSFALRELLLGGAAQIQRPVRVVDDFEERAVIIEELARFSGMTVTAIEDLLARLADDWDTLSIDGDGWEEGFPNPSFLGWWQRHREVYGYTLRSELVYQLLQELRLNPNFRLSKAIQVLLVDEYQDLNRCDLTTIRLIVERSGCQIYASGDDDQSIYSFRHAHPRGIREFTADFEGSTSLDMMECLRCGPEVVHLGTWLISQDAERLPKKLQSVTDYGSEVTLLRFNDQHDEAGGLAQIIAREIQEGCPPEEILVLLRSDPNQRTSAFLSDEFAKQGIETYRPRAFAEPPDDLQRLIEYLVLAESLRAGAVDSLALRVLLQLEPNGIGFTRLRAAVEHALEWRVTFAGAIERLRKEPEVFSRNGVDRLLSAASDIVDRARSFAHRDDEAFTDWVDRIADALDLSDETRSLVAEATNEVMAALEDMPGGLENAPISYVQELMAALAGLQDSRPTRLKGKVTVTSMHGAKGLSADVVFVLQAEDEILPGDTAGLEYEEARRLLYVSLTRARRKLFVGACRQRTDNQEWVRDKRIRRRTFTRFLEGYGLVARTAAEYLAGGG